MLARLGIRQKLSLLLTVPLTAVVLVLVPFLAERVDDARSAATTAQTAVVAREMGALIQALQEERLLALGYLSAPSLDRSALAAQSQTALDVAAGLRADPAAAAVIREAGPALDALEGFRQEITRRTIPARTAYFAYRDATAALLDALHLTNPPGVDAAGLSQLVALDALMRSSEEASSIGAILVAAAADSRLQTLLADAITADRQYLRRFRELAGPEQAALIDTVDSGQAGQRMRAIIDQVTEMATESDGGGSASEVSEALTAAVSYTGLRRLAQDRSARDIAIAASTRAASSRNTALGVTAAAIALFAVVVVLGITVSRSISRPLRRLTRAAAVVADVSRSELVRVADTDSPDPAPPRLAAVHAESADEIGELAAALNQVQATAALMLERQVSARHNVAVMFANIARRTQSLVGRQVSLIDDLERNQFNPQVLRRLYQLEHVTTRLRRSAESLLIVSGTIDPVLSGQPRLLVDVVRSALSEIEDYRAVQLAPMGDIVVNAGLVGDLRLVLAELLENATNFSPPSTPVLVNAAVGSECQITIIDHGVGMSPARLAEENRRLVERERLDVTPTSVLGLFVVGRLARRHGLSVRLHHSGGRGVTATVSIPLRLLSFGLAEVAPRSIGSRRSEGRQGRDPVEAVLVDGSNGFAWFGDAPDDRMAIAAAPQSMAESRIPASSGSGLADSALAASGSRLAASGLSQRVPGAHLEESGGATAAMPGGETSTIAAARDPDAEREVLNQFLSGLSRGEEDSGEVSAVNPFATPVADPFVRDSGGDGSTTRESIVEELQP